MISSLPGTTSDDAMANTSVEAAGRVAYTPRGSDRGIRRVCHVLDSLNIGGTETQAVELARRLDPAQYEVTLACLQARGPLAERLKGSSVRLLEFHPKGGMNSPGGIYQLLRMAAFLRRGRFDIVHAHDLWANLLAVPAAWMARVPVILSSQRDLSHLDFYQGRNKKWLRRVQKLSRLVVANAGSIRDGLIADEDFSPDKVRVIYNGVDMDRFTKVQPDRGRLFPGVTGKLVAFVGNMHTDVKGHPTLIAAAAEVVRDFPETRFLLVGDGAARSDFEAQAASLGIQANVLFLGRRDDVPEILACSDVAVLPSKAEGLPNAVLEYLAAGLPTVASNVGGNAEVIREGVSGLLVPPGDAGALSSALLKVLRDPDLARRLGAAGQEHVRTNFSFERMIDQVDQLYTELLEPRGGR
jgi:glycosyltransferase involved in cell wall biosynthesis